MFDNNDDNTISIIKPEIPLTKKIFIGLIIVVIICIIIISIRLLIDYFKKRF